MTMPWTVYIDGGARGNPGPAGAGVYIQDAAGRVAFAGGFFLGSTTNNRAEYSGLLNALTLLEQAGADEVRVFSDSQLMVRQVNGEYRVKSPGLKPLYAEAMERFGRFRKWTISHVYRESNTQADEMANRAMDDGCDIVVTDRLERGGHEQVDPVEEQDRLADATEKTSVTVAVKKSPSRGACAAGLTAGQTFVFNPTTPSGLCVEGCAAVIEQVVAIQQKAVGHKAREVVCGEPGCGALFEIRRTG